MFFNAKLLLFSSLTCVIRAHVSNTYSFKVVYVTFKKIGFAAFLDCHAGLLFSYA